MSTFIPDLKNTLKQDISDLDTLLKLLSTERTLLQTRKSDEIDAISKHKSSLVNQIELRAKAKAKLFASSGLGVRPGKVEETLRTLNDDELTSLWNVSRDKLALCKERNLVNGAIINRSLSRTTKLMNILRGKSNAPNLYGQKGREQSYAGTQRIGKA